ncbi:MAG: DUF2130 domain-containing protein [Bacteroidota bacterium]|nr:DUF2130 domain-containing protein [Bacteroidota bacterium]
MAEFITCPKCGHKIQLTEAFTHDIEEKLRVQFESEIKKKDAELKQTIESKDKELQASLARERAKLEVQAKKQAQESVSVELKDLQSQLQEKAKQLDDAQEKELQLRKQQRELEEEKRSLKLEVQRTLDAERKNIREQTIKEISEEQRFKEAEKDNQLAAMREQIEVLKRKAELTSQQLQGEVQEIELETILSQQFKHDTIEPVAKGVRGADVIQLVRDERGQLCGKIIWESKRTKAWSDGWVQKLKDDQRASKAEIAVIVTTVLPKEINRFGYYDGIWVTDFPSTIGLAMALRENLIQIAFARTALVGKNEKMELIYNYLTGSEFAQRVQGIVESFIAMKEDLDAEKRAMEKLWAKREGQINRVIKNTSGMYGDLQSIAGSSLPEIKMLQMPE